MINFLARVLNRLLVSAYSALVRARLASCGLRLSARFPVRLDGPGAIELGSDVSLGEHAWLNCEPSDHGAVRLKIGKGCYLGRFVHINAREMVEIGDDVLIADRVFITDYHHGHADPDLPVIRQQLTLGRKVSIGSGAWIGEGAVIMPGVSIGARAVVGANAVVTTDVPANAVARGVPARIFANRSE